MSRLPTYFISHGGGPWPWVPDMRQKSANLEASLKEMVGALCEKPRAVLMISGYWEADIVKVMSSPNPPMVHDYYNFPPHTYEVQYPSPGAPELAHKTLDLLATVGEDAATRIYHDKGLFGGVTASSWRFG